MIDVIELCLKLSNYQVNDAGQVQLQGEKLAVLRHCFANDDDVQFRESKRWTNDLKEEKVNKQKKLLSQFQVWHERE